MDAVETFQQAAADSPMTAVSKISSRQSVQLAAWGSQENSW
jgi:hypothetical protein